MRRLRISWCGPCLFPHTVLLKPPLSITRVSSLCVYFISVIICQFVCASMCSYLFTCARAWGGCGSVLCLSPPFPPRQSLTKLRAHHFLVLRTPGVLARAQQIQCALLPNLFPCPIIISLMTNSLFAVTVLQGSLCVSLTCQNSSHSLNTWLLSSKTGFSVWVCVLLCVHVLCG